MTTVVPIPPDVWARMSRHAQDRARDKARRYLALRQSVERAHADDVVAQARALFDALPPDDPADCARRAAICTAAIYGE